jgi:hypothetical protein
MRKSTARWLASSLCIGAAPLCYGHTGDMHGVTHLFVHWLQVAGSIESANAAFVFIVIALVFSMRGLIVREKDRRVALRLDEKHKVVPKIKGFDATSNRE